MRITKKRFSRPALTSEGVHYFPYYQAISRTGDNTLGMPYAFYDRSRQKWFEDIAYLPDMESKLILDFAIQKGLLKTYPSGFEITTNKFA